MSDDQLDNFSNLLDFKLIPVFQRFDDLEREVHGAKRQSISMEKILVTVDAKVDTVDAKVDTVDAKVDTVDAKVDTVDAKIDRVENILSEEIKDGFAGIGDSIGITNDRLDSYITQTDRRLTRLEKAKA